MTILKILMALSTILATAARAQGQGIHVKHLMVLVGNGEVFASHVVYKVPHNFQVILSISLPTDAKQAYLLERSAHPNDNFFFQLDPIDLSAIREASEVSGSLLRESEVGIRTTIFESVTLRQPDFSVLFFNELPLSLEGSPNGPAAPPSSLQVRAPEFAKKGQDSCRSDGDCSWGQRCSALCSSYTNQCRTPPPIF